MFSGRMGGRAAQATERAGRAVSGESTTPDLVELAQRWSDGANAGDIDAATSLFAPDIVWEGVFQTFEGRAAARGFVQDWLERTTLYLDIDEARAAAERLARERG